MEVLVEPTIQKALALRENPPTPKIHKTFVTAETMTKLKGEKTHTTLETSKSTDQIKERQNDGHDLTQDKGINGEPVTERGNAEASQALIANDAQASLDVMEKDDTIRCGEQTHDQRQSSDVEYRPQTCESPTEDEAVQKINLDE
jgi:hypothetical protein